MNRLVAMSVVMAASLASTAAMAMRAEIVRGPSKTCFDTRTPPVRLVDVPAGTATLKVRFVNLDDWTDSPVTGTIEYRGQDLIPYGTLRYLGRCGRPFDDLYGGANYEVRVASQDATGRVLASARDRGSFPFW